MFRLESAKVTFQGKDALTDITLSIPEGQKVALIGRSGAGKSTLLNLLYQQRPEDISLVPQDYGLVSSLSLYHNVYMGKLGTRPLWYNLMNLVRPFKQSSDDVQSVLAELQLDDKLFEPVAQLSGGQQQRAAIARAMIQPSEILCADEPVSSLDEQQSKLVMGILCKRFQTLVLAMHDIDLALEYCDRIIGLDMGRITMDAQTAALKRSDLLELYGE